MAWRPISNMVTPKKESFQWRGMAFGKSQNFCKRRFRLVRTQQKIASFWLAQSQQNKYQLFELFKIIKMTTKFLASLNSPVSNRLWFKTKLL